MTLREEIFKDSGLTVAEQFCFRTTLDKDRQEFFDKCTEPELKLWWKQAESMNNKVVATFCKNLHKRKFSK